MKVLIFLSVRILRRIPKLEIQGLEDMKAKDIFLSLFWNHINKEFSGIDGLYYFSSLRQHRKQNLKA